MDWSPAGGTTGPRNQLLSIVAYTGPAPKHAPKPASVTGHLVLVLRDASVGLDIY